MKIHLGCGTVYLRGYVNIDSAPTYLTSSCSKDILDQNATTADLYYKQAFGTLPGFVVADLCHDLRNPLPFPDGAVEEVIMYHVLEHFPVTEAAKLIADIARALRPGGVLLVSVPDIKGTAKLLAEAATEQEEDWAIRLIHGTQRNRWSHHYCGYVPRTLMDLLSRNGFGMFEELPNINFYPAIRMRAIRSGAAA